MLKKLFIFLVAILVIFVLFPGPIFANLGVGVNTGKIQVDEKLKAGMIYKLPSIGIINTGDEPGDYGTSIAYQDNQPELRPAQDWFIFTPATFHLEPGQLQLVEVKINLPLKMEPGNYFAYLEGHPVSTVKKGLTTLGVAAASKLYFTVTPANVWYGIYYKITTFFKVYAPWPQRVVIAILLVGLLVIFKRYFKLQVNFKKKPAGDSTIDNKKNE